MADDSARSARPFVFANMAMTADGKITSGAREYPRFTSAFDKKNMDRLRARADAILVGAGTLRADNPRLDVRDPEIQSYRRSLGKPERLVQLVVSASAELPAGARFFDGPKDERIVATTDRASAESVRELERRVEVWRLGAESVDLRELLRRLKERGVESLLVEGGGDLNWGFVRDDLLDELFVTVAPVLLGGRDAPTLLEGVGLAMAERRRLRLVDLHREGDELYCRYEVVRS